MKSGKCKNKNLNHIVYGSTKVYTLITNPKTRIELLSNNSNLKMVLFKTTGSNVYIFGLKNKWDIAWKKDSLYVLSEMLFYSV